MAFAIIAAGGLGVRMGTPTPKSEIELLGKPILSYSLEAFQGSAVIESMVLVVPESLIQAWAADRLRADGISKLTAVVAGGETRQDSVRRGLEEIEAENGIVVVHDGARPLVTSDIIERACEIPAGADGVITAVGVTDTIKEIVGASVTGTHDRKRLAAVQTPQAFRIDVLRRAHLSAREHGFEATDDSSLVERIGGRIVVVDGSRGNIKVTFPEDLARAEAIIRERSRS